MQYSETMRNYRRGEVPMKVQKNYKGIKLYTLTLPGWGGGFAEDSFKFPGLEPLW